MSQHLKTISSQHVVSKISRTFKPPDSTWIEDCIEDIGWAIQAIGYHAGFIKKSTPPPYITVANHRGKIPCDVERVMFVESLKVDSSAQNTLNPDGTTPYPQTDDEVCPPVYKGVKMLLSSDRSMPAIDEETPRTTNMNTSALYNSYWINGDYIVTGFESGLIKIHGIHFNIDKKGAPNIVDDFDYKSCCEFYCIAQMIFRGFKHPELSYRDAFAMFEMYRLRAENACKVMGLDSAERFDKSINRYIRSVDFGANFYAGLEQQEYISK
jgi:hypothetical protein